MQQNTFPKKTRKRICPNSNREEELCIFLYDSNMANQKREYQISDQLKM